MYDDFACEQLVDEILSNAVRPIFYFTRVETNIVANQARDRACSHERGNETSLKVLRKPVAQPYFNTAIIELGTATAQKALQHLT